MCCKPTLLFERGTLPGHLIGDAGEMLACWAVPALPGHVCFSHLPSVTFHEKSPLLVLSREICFTAIPKCLNEVNKKSHQCLFCVWLFAFAGCVTLVKTTFASSKTVPHGERREDIHTKHGYFATSSAALFPELLFLCEFWCFNWLQCSFINGHIMSVNGKSSQSQKCKHCVCDFVADVDRLQWLDTTPVSQASAWLRRQRATSLAPQSPGSEVALFIQVEAWGCVEHGGVP